MKNSYTLRFTGCVNGALGRTDTHIMQIGADELPPNFEAMSPEDQMGAMRKFIYKSYEHVSGVHFYRNTTDSVVHHG